MATPGRTRRGWAHGLWTAAALAASALIGLAPGASAAPAPLPEPFNFFSGIGPELTNPGGSLPGSNDFSCTPTAEHPRPVVLVHGTGGAQQTNWGTYVPFLKNQGFCVFALTYGAHPGLPWPVSAIGGMTTMERSAQQLADFVDGVLAATGSDQVDLVGHSQGTLMPTYYAKFLGGADKIDNYVSLAPLWQGTTAAGATQLHALGRQLGIAPESYPMCQACAQFDPLSDFGRQVASGGSPYLPQITYTNISTRYDEMVVPYTSGQLAGGANVHNVVVQDGCEADHTEHAGLAGSQRAAFFVLNALDPEHPREVPCLPAAPFTGSAPTS
ncbi:alpha/beta fold hydrolase [Rhodococcus sp. HNM0569]|uniref:esterase/lipase family protein n=1 Tax=Rhodococcus sp. HNM0569 TaxID=2716340 RepID=UPI00146D2D68|nr:alpha/beta fold hydrolase [Rhodococcus sp. HNM0569]NLU84942.1 alpha/beta fold hydrolase [Rhodococcus sp. HNM0569]